MNSPETSFNLVWQNLGAQKLGPSIVLKGRVQLCNDNAWHTCGDVEMPMGTQSGIPQADRIGIHSL